MITKEKKIIVFLSTLLLATSFTIVSISTSSNLLLKGNASEKTYLLNLNNSTSYQNFSEKAIFTSSLNRIDCDTNASSGEDTYWGSFGKDEYFANVDPINSIKNITLNYSGDDTCFILEYGFNKNALTESLIIASGISYELSERPSYFKISQVNEATSNVTSFNIVYSCNESKEAEYDGLKLLSGPGTPVALGVVRKGLPIPGSSSKVSIEFNINSGFFADNYINFYFDLASSFGTPETTNGFYFSMPKSGMVLFGPNGRNSKCINSNWSFSMNDGASVSVTKNTNTAAWFEFTGDTLKKWNPTSVLATWNFNDSSFTLDVGNNGNYSWKMKIINCLTTSLEGNYFPTLWVAGSNVGDYIAISNFKCHLNNEIVVSNKLNDGNSLCYKWPFEEDICLINSKYKFYRNNELHNGETDFVVDIKENQEPLIVQLTDIQIIDSSQVLYKGRLSEGETLLWAPEQKYNRAFRHMRSTILQVAKKEGRNPDLIVMSGDNTYGQTDFLSNSVDGLIKELDSYGIKYALTYGNHDQEAATGVKFWKPTWDLNKNPFTNIATITTSGNYYIAQPITNMANLDYKWSKGKNALFMKGHSGVEGHANYTVGFRQNGKLRNVVYLVDSHGNSFEDLAQEVYADTRTVTYKAYNSQTGNWEDNQTTPIVPTFKQGQISWFENTTSSLSAYPSVGFCHHPFKAWGEMAKWYGFANPKNNTKGYPSGGVEGYYEFKSCPDISKSEYSVYENDNGGWYKEVSYGQYVDEDFTMHNICKANNVKGFFFGHEHCLHATVTKDNIRYGFGLKASTYDSYIRPAIGASKTEVGGTLIKFNDQIGCTSELIFSVFDN